MERELGVYVPPFSPDTRSHLEALRRHGIRFVGFDGTGVADVERWRELRKELDDLGLDVESCHAVGSLVPYNPPDDTGPLWDDARRDIDRCHVLRGRYLVFHFRQVRIKWWPGSIHEQAAYFARRGLAEVDRFMTEVLARACEYAYRLGVTLVLENLPFAHQRRASQIVEVVEAVGAPNLGICFDSGHAHAAGLDPGAEIRRCGRHLLTTHFHDNLGPSAEAAHTDVDLHLVPGLGTINWIDVIHALGDVGYANPVVFEGVTAGKNLPWDIDRTLKLLVENWRALETIASNRGPGEDR